MGVMADLDPVQLDESIDEIDWTVLPPGCVRDVIRTPSGALARISAGPTHRRRVVLVPGATGSKEDFLLMLPSLTDAGYRVEAFDLAGQYESAGAGPENLRPPGSRYDLDEFVDDLIAVLASGSTPAHLLGYSFAGTIAAAATTRRPDLVATLTLLSAPPLPGRSLAGFKRVGPLAGRAGPRLSAAVMLQGLRWNVTRVGPRRQAFVRARLRRTRLGSVRDILRLMASTPDLAPAVRATGVPVLVAVGTGDLWPMDLHRQFAATIGAAFAAYRTGHSPCETAPHQLVADLLRLFERVDPSTSA